MEPPQAVFESDYRRLGRAVVGVLLLLAGFMTLVVVVANQPDLGPGVENFLILAFFGTVPGMLGILFNSLRRHRWSVSPEGLLVEEMPRVRLTSRRRRALIPFAEIRALRRLERGLHLLLEVETRDGRRYVLGEALRPAPPGLDAFQAALAGTAAAAGHSLPPVREGLDGLSRPPGLILQAVLLVVTLPLPALVLWMLFVDPPDVRPRGEG